MRGAWLAIFAGLWTTTAGTAFAQETSDPLEENALRNALYASHAAPAATDATWIVRSMEVPPDRPRHAAPAETCDSDLDGALYGTLAGAAPGFLYMVTSPEGEARLVPTILMFAGGFVGFWVGLAVDSIGCEEEEPE